MIVRSILSLLAASALFACASATPAPQLVLKDNPEWDLQAAEWAKVCTSTPEQPRRCTFTKGRVTVWVKRNDTGRKGAFDIAKATADKRTSFGQDPVEISYLNTPERGEVAFFTEEADGNNRVHRVYVVSPLGSKEPVIVVAAYPVGNARAELDADAAAAHVAVADPAGPDGELFATAK